MALTDARGMMAVQSLWVLAIMPELQRDTPAAAEGLLFPQRSVAVRWLIAVPERTCPPVAGSLLRALSPADPAASPWPRCASGRRAHESVTAPSPPSRSR